MEEFATLEIRVHHLLFCFLPFRFFFFHIQHTDFWCLHLPLFLLLRDPRLAVAMETSTAEVRTRVRSTVLSCNFMIEVVRVKAGKSQRKQVSQSWHEHQSRFSNYSQQWKGVAVSGVSLGWFSSHREEHQHKFNTQVSYSLRSLQKNKVSSLHRSQFSKRSIVVDSVSQSHEAHFTWQNTRRNY